MLVLYLRSVSSEGPDTGGDSWSSFSGVCVGALIGQWVGHLPLALPFGDTPTPNGELEPRWSAVRILKLEEADRQGPEKTRAAPRRREAAGGMSARRSGTRLLLAAVNACWVPEFSWA